MSYTASKYLKDVLDQPGQWQQCLAHCLGAGSADMRRAAQVIKHSKRVVISAIGASYSAGLALEHLFKKAGIAVQLEDCSELMNQFICQEGDVLLLLSRSGKSVELLKVMALAKAHGVVVLSICNDLESPLAKGSDQVLWMNVRFDHAISVATYSAIILVGIVLQAHCSERYNASFETASKEALNTLEKWINNIDYQCFEIWTAPENYYYFLGRGSSRAASYEAALLWEEGVKMPAVTKTTGSFRHGPQEVVSPNLSVMIWLEKDSDTVSYDLQLCRDLKSLGVKILIIGTHDLQDLKAETLELPHLPSPFEMLGQQIPAQLAAHFLAQKKGTDPDTFRYCEYIVNKEGGLW
jgi:glucosamine--fructose-6-phosphate aminotransferase (isomerizing)